MLDKEVLLEDIKTLNAASKIFLDAAEKFYAKYVGLEEELVHAITNLNENSPELNEEIEKFVAQQASILSK